MPQVLVLKKSLRAPFLVILKVGVPLFAFPFYRSFFYRFAFSSSDIWDYLELDDPSTSNDPTGDGLPLARPLQQALEEGLPSPISVDDFLIADVPLVAPLGHPSPSVDIRGHHPPMASVPPAEDVFSDSDLLVGKSGAGGQRQLPSGIVERLLCVSFFFFFFAPLSPFSLFIIIFLLFSDGPTLIPPARDVLEAVGRCCFFSLCSILQVFGLCI